MNTLNCLIGIGSHSGTITILLHRRLQNTGKMPVKPYPVFPLLTDGRYVAVTLYIAIDDVDRHSESRSSSQPPVFCIRLPLPGHNGVTGGLGVVRPHPKP